ncbi:YobA family protein [Holdemania massiliensis]|uniref:YobA family protein n=1 Tax=Holdemania massiliensis TaxID=1468449 RepID=UPI001F06F523|nr:YobA family protein [Holdemania massiliensis]MCH1942280.1 YobA family protein [Holdemania massiliensis]
MKRCLVFTLALACVIGIVGCSSRTMNYIIENEPSITGIVEKVQDNFIVIYINTEGYPNGSSCKVSLNVENKDSYTDVSVGDEITVYYNGEIAESAPLQINTVYGITLKTPANQDVK